MGLKESFDNKQIILAVVSKMDYMNKSAEIIKSVDSEKVCYVALNKPYNSIISFMNQNGIDSSRFYFIDVLTATVETPPQVDNCSFVESPNALTDISLEFSSAMEKCDSAIFDAISTLIIHESQDSVIKLTQNLMTKIRVTEKKAVFVSLKEDSDELIKDLAMFVDDIVYLS